MIYETWQLWALLSSIFLVFEIFIPGMILGCLAVGALGGSIGAALGYSIEGQMIAASISSILAFAIVRPLFLKWFNKNDGTKIGIEALVGRSAVVTKPVDSSTQLGRCKIDGDDWRMKVNNTENNNDIKIGDSVEIIDVDSTTLIVKIKSN